MDAVNVLFLLLCSLLVLLMTPALSMFYSGLVGSKNTLNTIMNGFIVFGVVTFQWVAIGFSLSFSGDVFGLIGDFKFAFWQNLQGVNENGVPNILIAAFQMMFALIATSIITGSLVGRVRLGVLVVFLLFWSTIVYDSLAHMIWAGGWLQSRGGLDFAGGGVVHISSGVAGLVGALIVGSRKTPEQNGAHSVPYAFLGAILLFMGWLGFNAGSAAKVDEIAVNAFIVTVLAAASGFVVWVALEWIKERKPSILGSLSGLVAGLVGITPACGYVSPLSSIAIGGVSALLCYGGLFLIKYRLKLDDSLDAFSLHGIGGVWGGVATGLFASGAINPAVVAQGALGEGLFVSGSFALLEEQLFSILVCVVFSGVVSYVLFKLISLFTTLRVKDKVEEKGLDEAIHGENAYNI